MSNSNTLSAKDRIESLVHFKTYEDLGPGITIRSTHYKMHEQSCLCIQLGCICTEWYDRRDACKEDRTHL